MVCSRLIRVKPKPAGCIPGLLGLKQNIQGVSQVTWLNLNLQGVSQVTRVKPKSSGSIPGY